MRILSIEEATKFAQNKKVVIITGVTGQDGSFMADYLLKNTDYEIFGGARRLSVANHENVDHLQDNSRFHLINFDLTDAHSIAQTISQLKPSYFINFAAQSFVKSSWDFPAQTWETNTTSMIHILESIRLHCPGCRFYNAGSSEEFGDVVYSPQDEKHPMRPRSPYGASKAAARQLVKVYRESYGLYAVQGWLFNHEGTRRGEEFVTRKITKNVARIVEEMKGNIITPIIPMELGNLSAKRDWSDAEDCVQAVWRMLNQEAYNPKYYDTIGTDFHKKIQEYVVASGESHTIREFVDLAFECALVRGRWEGTDVDEKFVFVEGLKPAFRREAPFQRVQTGTVLVRINPANYRPAEVEQLMGDPTRIKTELGWNPQTDFRELIYKMVTKDLKS